MYSSSTTQAIDAGIQGIAICFGAVAILMIFMLISQIYYDRKSEKDYLKFIEQARKLSKPKDM